MGGIKRNKYFVILLAIILLFFSILDLRDISFDILPEFQPKKIKIQTEALGLAASEVENLVTINVEEMLTNTPWMTKMESTSVNGLSSVELTFKADTDIMEARQMVSENLVLSQQIPNVSQETIILQPRSTTNIVMAVGLYSENLSLIDISQLSRWNIRPALMSVPGVANVSIWGHRERQLQVQTKQEKIRYSGVSLEDVVRTTGNAFWMSNLTYLEASTPGSGGWIDTPNQRLEIQHILPMRNEEDLSRLSFPDISYLTLDDVADVVEDHQPLIGDALLDNGKGILLVIEKYPWSDVLDITKGVEEKIQDLKVGLSDIEVDTAVFKPATFVESMVDNLSYAFIFGSILMFVGLVIFIAKIRVAFFAFISIILSLVTTFFILNLYGSTFNTILIAGIIASVAIIIDQTINGLKNTKCGSIQSILVTILLFIPVFFLSGETGLFYRPLAIAYAVSIVSGMFSGLVVFPSLVKAFSSELKIQNRNIAFVRRLKKMYLNTLTKIMQMRSIVWILVTILITIGSIGWLISMERDLVPTYHERTLIVDVENTPGSSLPEMNRIIGEISNDLQSIDGVNNFSARIGRAVTGDRITGINSAQIWVNIDEKVDYDITKKAIDSKLAVYPEIIKGMKTYSQEIINEHLVSDNEEIFVRIYGTDFVKLQEQAEKVKNHISRVDGVISPNVVEQSFAEVPGIQIKVDFERTNRYGLKPGDIRRAAATIVNGLQVANRFEEQKVYEVVVWSVPEERKNIDDIKNILIDTPNGQSVRLGEVAEVNVVPMMSSIEREGMSRYIDVVFDIRGDKKDIANNLVETLGDIEFPLEYHAVVVGDYADYNNLLLAIACAFIGSFRLIQSVFNSWRLAMLNFVIVPTALFGGILGIYISDSGVLSLGSLIGLIVVLAITYRNGIMSIRHYQSLEQQGVLDASSILCGARDRFVPIIMNLVLISLFFAPLIVMGKVPGLELGHSISVVVIGGLITSTLLNIFILPKLYLWTRNKYNHES